jgi:uncharacterized membrane protein YqgA involved in biofilm formation
MHLTGTLLNVATVLAGTILGSVFRGRLPERIRETVIHALGLVTIVVGVDGALAAFRPPLSTATRASVVIVLGSVLVGGVIGEVVGIDRALNSLGEALKRRFGRGEARFTEGFVVASLVFCVGPLTILGAIHDGLTGDYQLLAIKSVLDGFAALAFASALGWGVGFSVITILLYQGGIALGASSLRDVFTPTTIAALSAAGGVLILGIGFRLLDLVTVRVANLLPALLLAPVALAIVDRMH